MAKTRIYNELFNRLNYTTQDIDNGYYIASPKNTSHQKTIDENETNNRFDLEYGFFEISPKFSTNGSLFVTHLELNQESRNRGLFKSLLNDIISYAKENEYTNIVLEPDITKGKDYYNKLVTLYKKYGFNEIEDDPSLLKLDF
jgi:GNAT superfamily N-acetyltransferase